MDRLSGSVATLSLAADDQVLSHRPTMPRFTLSHMPVEILVVILLMVRDAAVEQAGYTQAGFDFSSSSTSGTAAPDGSPWMGVTHVCARLRGVALATPMLWTIIILEDGALWASMFTKRSGVVPLSIYAYRRRSTGVRKQRALLATIPHFGTQISRLVIQGYEYASVQGLLDSLDWACLELTSLSVGNLSSRPKYQTLRLPPAFLANPGPCLTSLNLGYLMLDSAQPRAAFMSVRRLRLERPQFEDRGRGTSIGDSQIDLMCKWLKEMPLLEELTLLHTPEGFRRDALNSRHAYGRYHLYLRKLSIARIFSLPPTLALLNKIGLPSEAFFISFNASEWARAPTRLDQDLFPRLVDYLRQFGGQATVTGANSGAFDKHLPTIRLRPKDSDPHLSSVTLSLHLPDKPTHLRLHLFGLSRDLLPVLRITFQQLFPIHIIEELRVYGPQSLASGALDGDLHLLDACRTLIVDSMELTVPGFAMLPRLRELRIRSSDENGCPDPGTLLLWLRCRDGSDAPRLERLTFEGATGLQGAEHTVAMDSIRLLVGELRWE
jgi:hypothetical protein